MSHPPMRRRSRLLGLVILSMTIGAACGREPRRVDVARASADAAAPPARVEPPRSQHARLYDDPSLFTFKLAPRPGDWLERFRESGQTFTAYEVSSPIKPTPARNKLVLQPLGAFRGDDERLLAKLEEHMGLFFGLPVEVRRAVDLPARGRRIRHEGTRSWPQYQTTAIMDDVLKKRVPDDAVVFIGVTTADLYPDAAWNFVFGQARFEERVGVYSLARMFDRFEGRPDTDESRVRGLGRSTAILAHETGHAFGIAHCTRFECVMNGSNSLEELDRQFAEPCPVCLRKLAWNIGLDPVRRYEKLRDFYRREKLESLASWIDRRLERVRGSDPSP